MAGRVLVVGVVEAGRRASIVGGPLVAEGAGDRGIGPGGNLVADQVVGEADLKPVSGAGMPARHRRVGALRATDLLDTPGAADHQRRKGLTRVGQHLQVGADRDEIDLRLELVAGPAGGYALLVGLAGGEQAGRGGELEQVVLERHEELIPAHSNGAGPERLGIAQVIGDGLGERVPGRLGLRKATIAALGIGRLVDGGICDRILLGAVVADQEHRLAADQLLEPIVEIAGPVGGELRADRARVADLLVVGGEVHRREDPLAVAVGRGQNPDLRVDRGSRPRVVGRREVLRKVDIDAVGQRELAYGEIGRDAHIVGSGGRLGDLLDEEVHVVVVDPRVRTRDPSHLGAAVDADRVGASSRCGWR